MPAYAEKSAERVKVLEPIYSDSGKYLGCLSLLIGAIFAPDEITEIGCNSQPRNQQGLSGIE